MIEFLLEGDMTNADNPQRQQAWQQHQVITIPYVDEESPFGDMVREYWCDVPTSMLTLIRSSADAHTVSPMM